MVNQEHTLFIQALHQELAVPFFKTCRVKPPVFTSPPMSPHSLSSSPPSSSSLDDKIRVLKNPLFGNEKLKRLIDSHQNARSPSSTDTDKPPKRKRKEKERRLTRSKDGLREGMTSPQSPRRTSKKKSDEIMSSGSGSEISVSILGSEQQEKIKSSKDEDQACSNHHHNHHHDESKKGRRNTNSTHNVNDNTSNTNTHTNSEHETNTEGNHRGRSTTSSKKEETAKEKGKEKEEIEEEKETIAMEFSELPEELQLQVFRFLTPGEILSKVMPVCRNWRKIASDESLWRFLHNNYFGGPRPQNRSWRQECMRGLARVKRHTRRYQADVLLWAAKHGHVEFARKLISTHSIDVNAARSVKSDATPLHLACSQGHWAMVDLLIKNGADVNARTNYGRTPLERAARNGHADIVQLLLFRKANVNAATDGGETALLVAAGHCHKKVVKLLLENDANVNASSGGFTAMRIATLQGYSEIVALLQKYNAN
jgi:hypothetical protein